MKRLYYDNPYLTSFEAEVLEVIEREESFAVVLDQTAFYPEGGGQPSDRGSLDGIKLLDVVEEAGTIYHILPQAPQNKTVKCEVDFERRFDHMQQHTGQHLVSAVFYSLYNGATNSFHLGEEYVSIDISLPEISSYMVTKVEDMVNDYIYKNLKIKTGIVEPEEAARLPLRKLPKVTESIRIVEIEGIDYSPCCGTHVKNLGEIGLVKIIKTEKYKGVTRIYIKSGKRALKDFQGKQEVAVTLMRHFSASENELPERAEALSLEVKELSRQVREFKERLLSFEADEIVKTAQNTVISMSFEDKSFDELQLLSKLLLERGSYLLILSSIPDRKLMYTHDGSLTVKCGQIFKEHVKSFSGRGGGGDKMAQAAFEDAESMEAFRKKLENA